MAHQYRLMEVPPGEIRFSKSNPRGEHPEEIKQDKAFEQLKDSVARFGVLVPIVVHEQGGDDGKMYTLVDGERRLRAALATGVREVPAHVAIAGDTMAELVQALHIHMLRKQWKRVAQARAIKRIRAELRKRGTYTGDAELLEELQAQTGCTDTQLKNLARVIRYPASVLREVEENKAIRWSHLVQFEESFVEQVESSYPALLKKVGKTRVREVLVDKARRGIIHGTRSLMENVVPVVARAKRNEQKDMAASLLERFIEDPSMRPEDIKKSFEKKYPPSEDAVELAEDAMEKADSLIALLGEIDVGQFVSFQAKAQQLCDVLSGLRTILTSKLRQFPKSWSKG